MSVSPQLISPASVVTYPYLWVVGHQINGQAIAQLPIGSLVGDRFQVVAAHVWKDTQPGAPLERDMAMPPQASPYLRLYAHRLYIPEIYGIYQPETDDASIMLLDNVPLDVAGVSLPTITAAWEDAPPVRQLYWLWQIGQLWDILNTEGVASSVLDSANIHVDGWRIRLRELIADDVQENAVQEDASLNVSNHDEPPSTPIRLHLLGAIWMSWAETTHPSIREDIDTIAHALQEPEATWGAIAPQLNTLLLQQAAQRPLRLDIAGATSPGGEQTHNEDACYPITLALNGMQVDDADDLIPQVAIVCDGIGGHSGGEVASQLTVRALKLQLRALFVDLAQEEEPLSPDIVMRQIEAAIRVVNNLVAFQNNEQHREDRQRMGTTLVMALQVPQQVETSTGRANTHEIYIAQVGDSRAYWLTPHGCHCLTVDDDVKTREVLAGRSLPREAERRTDAIALTQALGTRSGEYLHIKIQRFVVEEDGVMLLCSDGLSDSGMIDRYWQSMANNVLHGKLHPNKAVGTWLRLAEQHNGHDNASVVLMRCRVSREGLNLFDPSKPTAPKLNQPFSAVTLSSFTASEHDAPETTKPLEEKESIANQSTKNQSTATRKTRKRPIADEGVEVHPEWPQTNTQPEQLTSFSIDQYVTTSLARTSLEQIDDSSDDEFDELARTLIEPDNHYPSAPVNRYSAASKDDDQDWDMFAVAVGLSVVMFLSGVVGVMAWRRFAPVSFNEKLEQLVDVISGHLPLGGAPSSERSDVEEPSDTDTQEAL